MEHFLFYAMGLSFVSFLSMLLTKPQIELPPYKLPNSNIDNIQNTPKNSKSSILNTQPRVAPQLEEILIMPMESSKPSLVSRSEEPATEPVPISMAS